MVKRTFKRFNLLDEAEVTQIFEGLKLTFNREILTF